MRFTTAFFVVERYCLVADMFDFEADLQETFADAVVFGIAANKSKIYN